MSHLQDINTLARYLVSSAVTSVTVVWGGIGPEDQELILTEAEQLASNFRPPWAEYLRACRALADRALEKKDEEG